MTATMSATTTKITSLGSQYSASSAPSVPNQTPAADYVDNDIFDPPPPMDFAAVAKILGPIQESLNESADEAMYPSPPINTPEILSPAPSVVYRYPGSRGRGFSVIGDRLAQLKIDNRKFTHRDVDVASSGRSIEPSVADDDEYEPASTSAVLSDAGKEKPDLGHGSMCPAPPMSPTKVGSVPIALGSPSVNPRIEEYLSFTSKDLPTKALAPYTLSTLPESSISTKATVDLASSSVSLKSDGGVTEKSNWAEELEDSVDRACMRLEQLAKDEYVTDPSKSIEEYYIARLKRLLGNSKRVIPVKLEMIYDSHK